MGKVTQKQLKELAQLKMQDMNTTNLESAMRSMAGTARLDGHRDRRLRGSRPAVGDAPRSAGVPRRHPAGQKRDLPR